jgi:hypothetical protein
MSFVITHGEGYEIAEYRIWRAMIARCRNPNTKDFKNYGGRGIKVCPEWLTSYPDFLAHVGRRPDPKLTLDRIDNDGDYEPGNVRWATRTEQVRNARKRSKRTAEQQRVANAEKSRAYRARQRASLG